MTPKQPDTGSFARMFSREGHYEEVTAARFVAVELFEVVPKRQVCVSCLCGYHESG